MPADATAAAAATATIATSATATSATATSAAAAAAAAAAFTHPYAARTTLAADARASSCEPFLPSPSHADAAGASPPAQAPSWSPP